MKNTIGNAITVTLFGESHGEAIGAVIDGLSPGVKIEREYIEKKLLQRKAKGKISTARQEADEVRFLSGIFGGYTTGTPISLIIENTNTKSSDYEWLKITPRPSHADYTAECKYHGYQDYRGGGHFSGRVTAALVAAGAILESALENKGVYIGTRIKRLCGIDDLGDISKISDAELLNSRDFPTISPDSAEKMIKKIEAAAAVGDSVGGVLETAVFGMPAGVGEPWFDTVESMLSHAIFSVPAVKGLEFGRGFAIADMYGSEANDAFVTDGEGVYTKTNNNGGILGGITSGMPIIFRTAIKPTPSIFTEQDSVNLTTMENAKLTIKGRHDPAIIHRARAVIDAVTAIALCDLLEMRFGTDYFTSK